MTENNVSDDAMNLSKTQDFATVTGFMIIFITSSLIVACNIKEITLDSMVRNTNTVLYVVLFLVLIFAAGVLACAKKRFIVAATFIVYAFGILAPALPSAIFSENTIISTAPIGMAMIIFALAIITSCRKQEIECILILLLAGASMITIGFEDGFEYKWAIVGLEVCVAFISGLTMACFAVRSKKDRLYRFFESNPETAKDFWEAGTAAGTTIMTISMIASAMYYLHIGKITTNEMAALESASGLTLILLSIILVLSTKSKFTPFLFLMIGVSFTMTSFVTEIGQVLCVFTLVIGIICFLRNDGKNIIGASIIIYGFSYLMSEQYISNDYNDILSLVLNVVPILLLLYLSFAYLSKKNLPIA